MDRLSAEESLTRIRDFTFSKFNKDTQRKIERDLLKRINPDIFKPKSLSKDEIMRLLSGK